MIFYFVIVGLVVLMALVTIVNLWRDEMNQVREVFALPNPSPTLSGSTALHPSIDPYLAELREYLLRPPLPQGPGGMAERVYAHLTLWVNTNLTQNASYIDSITDDLLVGPTRSFAHTGHVRSFETFDTGGDNE